MACDLDAQQCLFGCRLVSQLQTYMQDMLAWYLLCVIATSTPVCHQVPDVHPARAPVAASPGGAARASQHRCLCSTRTRDPQTAAIIVPCSSSVQHARGSYPNLRRTACLQQRPHQGEGRQGSRAAIALTGAATACSSPRPLRVTSECCSCGRWVGCRNRQERAVTWGSEGRMKAQEDCSAQQVFLTVTDMAACVLLLSPGGWRTPSRSGRPARGTWWCWGRVAWGATRLSRWRR